MVGLHGSRPREMAMARTPQEVFGHHVEALGAGALHGKDGIRAAFTQLLADVPNADWTLKTQIFEGDVLFLEWAADAGATFANDGIDTFVFRDGLIQVQTVRYTLQHRG